MLRIILILLLGSLLVEANQPETLILGLWANVTGIFTIIPNSNVTCISTNDCFHVIHKLWVNSNATAIEIIPKYNQTSNCFNDIYNDDYNKLALRFAVYGLGFVTKPGVLTPVGINGSCENERECVNLICSIYTNNDNVLIVAVDPE